MAGRKKMKKMRSAQLFVEKDRFLDNAVILFEQGDKIVSSLHSENPKDQTPKQILEKMLHSILFMGNLHNPVYSPEEIFNDDYIYKKTKKGFQEPFEQYRTRVALRTPFSYFLELVVLVCGENNVDGVKDSLADTVMECKKSGDTYPLISAVICVCKSGDSRYYGASLSCGDPIVRDIMITLSCVNVWHQRVSTIVMAEFLRTPERQQHFINVTGVDCTAYTVETKKEKPPCMRCVHLYSLEESGGIINHTPGNCAETEAFSNLLNLSPGEEVKRGQFDNRGLMDQMTARFNERVEEKRRGRGEHQCEYAIDVVFKK